MSHHFSGTEFTVVPPGKEPASKKLQKNESLSAKRKEAKKLDIDNKQMEWRLQQLKEAMVKEKEDREKQGYIWKSGSIEKHSRNILGRTVSANVTNNKKSPHPPPVTSKSAKTKKKVFVLKDKPLDLPRRSPKSKNLVKALTSDPPSQNGVQQSIEQPVHINKEEWISVALEKGSEDIMELQSDINGNIPLSTVRAINPDAVGLYFLRWGRKRLLMGVDDIIRKPKTGWDTEIYYPYVAKISNDIQMKPEPPSLSHRKSPRKSGERISVVSRDSYGEETPGGKLLEGTYDEEASANAFRQAVNQWRGGSKEKENITNYDPSHGRGTPEMSVHAVQASPPMPQITFVEDSSLSYMEKVLLKNHRNTDVPAIRGTGELINDLNTILSGKDLKKYEYSKEDEIDPETIFTEEELDEREEIRKLFTPMTLHESDVTIQDASSSVTITEVEDDLMYLEEETNCIVEEEPVSKTTRKFHTSVVISDNFIEHSEGNREENVASGNSSQQPPVATGAIKHTTQSRNDTLSNITNLNEKSETYKYYEAPAPSEASNKQMVHEISKIPINPDAFYNRGLNDFFVWSERSPSQLEFMANSPEPITNAKITKGSGTWNPVSSVHSIDEFNNFIASSTRTSSPCSENEENPFDTEEIDLLAGGDIRCVSDSSEEDRNTINRLEWELASQTGNVMADGRISRLIDDWSEEDDLGIIEDTGVGSGLSTPDHDKNRSLPHSALNEMNSAEMQHDFQQMENIVLNDLGDEYSDNEF